MAYTRGRKSSLSGRAVPDATLVSIDLETMHKLGVKADVGREARALRDRITTQVLTRPATSVGKSRVRRKIAFERKLLCMGSTNSAEARQFVDLTND